MSSKLILQALQSCVHRAQTGRLTFGEAFAELDRSSFALLAIILSLPFLQPITLGPLSTVGGLAMAALGWQLACGRATPILPRKIKAMALSQSLWEKLLTMSTKMLSFFHRFFRPRLLALVDGRQGEKIVGMLICLGGLLLALPILGLPFNNTFPAAMIVCASLAYLERDGLLVFFAIFFCLLSVGYFYFGISVLVWILETINHHFGWFKQ